MIFVRKYEASLKSKYSNSTRKFMQWTNKKVPKSYLKISSC